MRSLILVFVLMAGIAQAQSLAVRAERIHTADAAGVIENGVVLVTDGRISAVGPAGDVVIPPGTMELEAREVLPGLIDARSTLGLSGWLNIPADQDMDETSDAVTPALRALDAFNPNEPLLGFVREFGVTTVQVGPGDANVIGGQAGIFKTAGASADAMALVPASAMIFNLTDAPRARYGSQNKAPATRMASAALIRQQLVQAQQAPAKDKPETDIGRAALRKVLAGELKAVFLAHRSSDIVTALRLIEEFDLDGQIGYGTEAYLVVERLRAAGVPVLLGPPGQRISGTESLNTRLDTAARLAAAGLPFAFGMGHEAYVPKSRIVLHEVALAVGNGLAPEAAVRAATIDAATLLGVADRVGSIAVGKDADLVLFDGDPFEYTSHVIGVVIDGVVVSREQR